MAVRKVPDILRLVALLRRAGLNVGPGETGAALRAVALVGGNEAGLEEALRCTLVGGREHLAAFEHLYHLWLMEAVILNGGRKECGEAFDGISEGFSGAGHGPGGTGKPATLKEVILDGQFAPWGLVLGKALGALAPLPEAMTERPADLVQKARLALDWNMVRHALLKSNLEEEEYDRRRRNLEWFDKELTLAVQGLLISQYGPALAGQVASELDLGSKDFLALEEQEILEIERRVFQLGKKLATEGWRHCRRGDTRLNLVATTRRALASGGVPWRLVKKGRMPSRPRLVVLCDVSGSVARYSRFLLMLSYSLRHCFQEVRTFVFIDELEEVTRYFTDYPPGEALALIFGPSRFSLAGLSHFGRVFQQLAAECLNFIDQRTTVIILGDARNNWRNPHPEALDLVSKRSRRVLWLNPLPVERWDDEDSVLGVYRPYCQRVLECRNLEQLEKVSRFFI